MKILLHCPGQFDQGDDSPVRGEGRWTLGLGKMLSRQGHDVTFAGSPGRGQVPGCRVISLNDPIVYEEYDVFADSTYLPSRANEIDAKVKIAMYWSWDDIAASIREKYGKDHFVGIATYSRYASVPEDAKKTFAKLLPFPVFEDFLWDKSNAATHGLYINVKYGFEDTWTLKRSIVTHALFHTGLDLAEEFDMPLEVLHSEHVFGGIPGIKCHMKPDLEQRLKNHPLVKKTYECLGRMPLTFLVAQG